MNTRLAVIQWTKKHPSASFATLVLTVDVIVLAIVIKVIGSALVVGATYAVVNIAALALGWNGRFAGGKPES